jgi:hypothetical protein
MYSKVGGGKKKDADLYEPVLDNPKAEKLIASARAARLTAKVFTAQEIVADFG